MEGIFRKLPSHLNVTYVAENEELEVAILEMDEQYSYVGNKKTINGCGQLFIRALPKPDFN